MRRGFSIVGLLIAVACMMVLYVILAESMKGALTGTTEEGGYAANSAPRMEDMFHLQQLMQSLNATGLGGGREGFPRPSAQTRDESDDTTANVYSLLIARRVVSPEGLISPMDRGLVGVYEEYDWSGYDPANGVTWDTGFMADLDDESHASYAHLVLYGDRAKRWSADRLDSSFPVFSNRGPRDGVASEESYACLPNGTWAGQVAFGDGHVSLIGSAGAAVRAGQGGPGSGRSDHFFRIDDDDRHGDAILGFTRSISRSGPILQWD